MESVLAGLQRRYNAYVDEFRVGGELPPMMKLKRVHTAFVAGNADAIARGEGFAPRVRMLAGAAALLHDTGRYEQLRKWNTFRDSESEDHAVLSHAIVRDMGWVEEADLEDGERDAVMKAVLYHNRKELPEGLGDLERTLCDTVRDADKLDIFNVLEDQVANTDWRNDCKAFWNLPARGAPSEAVTGAILRREEVEYGEIRTLADFVLIQVGWMITGLAYGTSRRLCAERGHLEFRRKFLAELTDSRAAMEICDMAAMER